MQAGAPHCLLYLFRAGPARTAQRVDSRKLRPVLPCAAQMQDIWAWKREIGTNPPGEPHVPTPLSLYNGISSGPGSTGVAGAHHALTSLCGSHCFGLVVVGKWTTVTAAGNGNFVSWNQVLATPDSFTVGADATQVRILRVSQPALFVLRRRCCGCRPCVTLCHHTASTAGWIVQGGCPGRRSEWSKCKLAAPCQQRVCGRGVCQLV